MKCHAQDNNTDDPDQGSTFNLNCNTDPLCATFIQDRKEILGELQFAFVCFLVGQGRHFIQSY